MTLRTVFDQQKKWHAELNQSQVFQEAMARAEAFHKGLEAILDGDSELSPPPPVSAAVIVKAKDTRTVWKGTLRDFGDWVLRELEQGKITAKSRRQAVIAVADQFVIVNKKTGQRTTINGSNVWQNLMNRYAERK